MSSGLLDLLIAAGIGSAVMSGISYFLTKFIYKNEETKLPFFVAVCIGAILGGLAKTTLLMNKELPRLVQAIESIEGLKTAENKFPHGYDPYASSWLWIENNIADVKIRTLFADGLNRVGENLGKLHKEGLLRVDRNDIFKVWKNGFELANNTVRATNRVAVEDWKFFSIDGDGAGVQNTAKERGVKIERIMLYDPSNIKQIDEFRKLAKQHEKLGVNVLWGNYTWETKRPFNQDYKKRLGTLDIVLFDNKLLLLTHVNNVDRKMEYAYLTADPYLIKIGNELYESLKKNSRKSPQINNNDMEDKINEISNG